MSYLLANIIFGSAFMLCIKWVQVRRREDVVTVGAINYIAAALLALPDYFAVDRLTPSAGALWTGGTMGACYFVAFFFVNHAIRRIGASSTTVIAVLSILVPIAFGVFLWNEQPNQFQIAGVFLALLSLTLIGGQSAEPAEKTVIESSVHSKAWLTPLVLLGFFLLCGLSRLAQEAFKHLSTADQRPSFLMSAFVVSAVPSVVVLLVRRRPIMPTEWGFGFLMGAANILQSHYILKSLQYYDGFIVFPVVSAGALMLTTLIAILVFDEQLTRKSHVGVATAVVALSLLYYLP